MSKVLVTGGAGFIGMNLVKGYIESGHEVIVVDNLERGKEENLVPGVTFYKMDITSQEFLEKVKEESPDIINHHAAQIDVQTSIKDPMYDARVNILGTLNILEACRSTGAKLVYPSSAAAYGDPEYLGVDENHPIKPMSAYGISKFTPEHYITVYGELYNVPYTIMRYANVYGIGQDPKGEGGVISILVDSLVDEKDFTIFGDGEQTRDFIFVEDIVEVNIKVSEKPLNAVINVSTGIPISLNDLVKVFQKVAGQDLQVNYGEERKGDIKYSYLLNEKVGELLSWKPKFSLEEGLLKTIEYYRSR